MYNQRNCPNCGYPIQPGMTRCQACGTHIPAPQRGYSNNYYSPSRAWLDNDAFASGPHGKSRGVAGLLALLVGTLGVHYFYLNKVGAGFLTILLSGITCGVWSILVFIQGILMLCMTNNEFERKYVTTPSWFPLF